MAIVSKDKLKSYFERGDRPNEEQFINLIDSMYSKQDDHDFTANTIVSTGGTTILTCKEDGGHMGTLYVNTLFVAGEEYDPGSDVPTMYGYKYDPSKPSFAELENNINTASGGYSHAEGYGSIAAGLGAHAEGGYNASNPGGWATGTSSHAEGVLTTASTPCSHAEGYKTNACGNEAHTEGDQTIAYSHAAHAEGSGSTASGESAHAEGHACVAKGYGAHAEGDSTSGLATGAHSEGYKTLAKSNYSHAGGSNTTAQTNCSFVHGSNITGSTNCAAHAAFGTNGNIAARESSLSKAIRFAICNGSSASALKNAFEVFSDGSVSFNESQLFTGVTTTVSSTSTDNQLPTAKACWNAITGNGLTQTTGDNRYLQKKSTSNSNASVGWGASGLTVTSVSGAAASHGIVVKGSGNTYIRDGKIDTSGALTVGGNATLKSGTTANTLTVTGSTNLKSGTTANTMYITGNFKLSSGVSANSITTAVTSSSTDQQLPTAKACYKAITGATSSYLKKNGDTATTLTATNLTMTKGLNFTLNKVFSDSNFTHNSGGYYSTSTPKSFVTFTDAYGTNEPVYIWYKSSDYPPGSIAFIQCGYHDNRDVYVAKGYSNGSTVWEKFATDNKIYMLIFSHRTFSIGGTVYASPSAYIDCSTINV